MSKFIFMIFLCILTTIPFAQLSEKNSAINNPRKLDESKAETILLGFDNYTRSNSFKNYTLSFYAYILLKNWDHSLYINDLKSNFFIIETYLNDSNKNRFEVDFICNYTSLNNLTKDNYINQYYLIRYLCNSSLIEGGGYPNFLNFTTNFSKAIFINGSYNYEESPSVEVFKKDLLTLRNKTIFNMENDENAYNKKVRILNNATFISQSPSNFKLKGELFDKEKNDNDFDSFNILLFTKAYGNPKRIPCIGKNKMDSDDYYYYFLESKGSNNLNNANLKYTVANFTTDKKDIFIIDFKEGANYQIEEKKVIKKSSGGLSTGGIVGIVIPSCIVLLGAAGLAFYLSRSAVPAPPINNLPNKTLGVASSEAIVHQ